MTGLSKRDHPQLKADLSEPYDFLVPRGHQPPAAAAAAAAAAGGEGGAGGNGGGGLFGAAGPGAADSYAPILSFYCGERFADVPFPAAYDWEAATGRIYPPHGSEMYTAANAASVAWGERVETAFFRGTATGGGVDCATNQRLNAARLSQLWAADPAYNGEYDDGPPYLSAGLTSWNFRDKVSPGGDCTLCFIQPPKGVPQQHGKAQAPAAIGHAAAGIGRLPPPPPRLLPGEAALRLLGTAEATDLKAAVGAQSSYKYLLYIEGHCAACRYTYMLGTGSLILRVLPSAGCPAPEMWYFPLLAPYVDHVPVRADLSDLAEVIGWCRSHDAECRAIAARGKALHSKYLGEEGILDYSELVVASIGAQYAYTAAGLEAAAAAGAQPCARFGRGEAASEAELAAAEEEVGGGGFGMSAKEAEVMATMGLPTTFGNRRGGGWKRRGNRGGGGKGKCGKGGGGKGGGGQRAGLNVSSV